jgi:hypothetical protein
MDDLSAYLRAICDSINDKRGTDGQSKLSRLIGWHIPPAGESSSAFLESARATRIQLGER